MLIATAFCDDAVQDAMAIVKRFVSSTNYVSEGIYTLPELYALYVAVFVLCLLFMGIRGICGTLVKVLRAHELLPAPAPVRPYSLYLPLVQFLCSIS
jgi:hypothetical protein